MCFMRSQKASKLFEQRDAAKGNGALAKVRPELTGVKAIKFSYQSGFSKAQNV